jgi:hypothetical protein
METVTLTFALTALAYALTALCASWWAATQPDLVGPALEASRREPPQNVRVRPARKDWRLSHEHRTVFLVHARKGANERAQSATGETRDKAIAYAALCTVVLSRMGEV